MVNVNVPVLVPVVVVTVSVEFAVGLGLTGVGSEQVAPAGQPVTPSPTLPLNPLNAVTVAVEVPVPPCVSVNDDGFAKIEKSGVGAAFVYASTSVIVLQPFFA